MCNSRLCIALFVHSLIHNTVSAKGQTMQLLKYIRERTCTTRDSGHGVTSPLVLMYCVVGALSRLSVKLGKRNEHYISYAHNRTYWLKDPDCPGPVAMSFILNTDDKIAGTVWITNIALNHKIRYNGCNANTYDLKEFSRQESTTCRSAVAAKKNLK